MQKCPTGKIQRTKEEMENNLTILKPNLAVSHAPEYKAKPFHSWTFTQEK